MNSYAQANGNSLSWTAQFQQQVYAMGQQEGLPVINMSFGSGWTSANNWEGDYPDVGNLSAYTNYANAHTYPNVGQTPGSAIQQLNGDAALAASSDPVITTEMGWQTSQFSETQIAQYVVDATFDGIAAGDAGVWFYGLYDDSSGDWGLFNSDGSPRPAATSLHNLTTLLADSGSDADSFTAGSLNYSLSGTQSGDNSILIEKSDGSFWIGLWDESGSQHSVTVNLGSAASEIEVFDPVTGTSSIQSASNTGSISVTLGSDPLLIEVVPSGDFCPVQHGNIHGHVHHGHLHHGHVQHGHIQHGHIQFGPEHHQHRQFGPQQLGSKHHEHNQQQQHIDQQRHHGLDKRRDADLRRPVQQPQPVEWLKRKLAASL